MALVGFLSSCSSCLCFLCCVFCYTCSIFHSFSCAHLLAFCSSRRFRHCMSIHSTPYCGTWVGYRHLQVHLPPHAWDWARTHFSACCPTTRVGFCSSFPEDGEAQFWFAMCISLFSASYLLACISIFSIPNFWHVLIFYLFLFYIFRFYIESPIRVFNADMFATPSTMFELPLYAADLAHFLAEAPFPPPSRTRLFNKLVLDFLDIKADQGEDSDRHGSPNSWLCLVC